MLYTTRQEILLRLAPRFGLAEARAMIRWMEEEPDGSYNPQEVTMRLLNNEPIQYIFGHTDWYGLRLNVNKHTLIPRPETAELVDAVCGLTSVGNGLRVLDIGTGSGCIAIKLKQLRPLWDVHACDVSVEAIAVAEINAENNLPSGQSRVHFFPCDILAFNPCEPISFDIIVSNPPYIRKSEQADMPRNVLDYEPHSALFVPDDNPLLFYKRIASLQEHVQLVFEINENLGSEMREMLQAEGYNNIQILKDLCGKERIVMAVR
ncbi:MAG: peptide chain release factor N(5)-glutamine methyltransferase [Paludibacteraceae bacterium]|nr:peptide chain release factor N(5)-glutamine methyltransferase [Paludibacteraceae bacterium]